MMIMKYFTNKSAKYFKWQDITTWVNIVVRDLGSLHK